MRPSPGLVVLQKNLMSDAQSAVVDTSPSPLQNRSVCAHVQNFKRRAL